MQNQTCLSSAEVQPNEGVANAPFEIPESWIWVRLSDVCQIVGRIGFRGYTKSDLVESNGAITLSPSNIVEGKMDYTKCTYISWKKYEESPEIQIQNGDILLVKTGSSYGKCALVENLPQKATINPQFVTLKYIAIQATILTYILQSDYARTNYDNFVLGTAIPTFTQVALGDMLIPLVPQNEQARILQEIARLFALIDEIDANKQNLQEYIKQAKSKVLSLAVHGKLVPQEPNDEPAIELLKRINPAIKPCDTSHYENLPKGWCVLTVGQVADYINGRAFKPNEWEKEGLPIIRIQNLNDEDAVYNYSKAKYEDRYLVHKGDLLFAWAASLGTYIWQKDDAWLNQHIFKVIPKPFIDKEFLYFSFINMIDDFYSESHGSGMVHITKGKFEERPIFIPPLLEQKRIVLQLKSIYNIIDSICSEL